MRNVLLLAQFDGTDFHGWQHQPRLRTVQTTLRQTLEQMVGHPVTLFGTSRTDAGVHARGLPVNFETERDISMDGFVRGLNSLLPLDLAVIDAREVPLGFRARDAAVAKTYSYRYQVGRARRPLNARSSWFVKRRNLDLGAMREAAALMVGEHDFSAFRAAHCDSHTTRRTLYRATVSAEDRDRVVTFEVTGNAFLRNMVRILAGTLAEVGWGRVAPSSVAKALTSGDRRDAGRTAPACGLTLTEVHFEGYPRVGKRGAPAPPGEV
ncbi:MAG: tRNA pseudouridine(38-40) synthase TruA [Proteobacteria bacterium]|nr:MAG: tRNA pseudouridine(38-40) synthase TruA [Pseudomonadota bacterium]